VYTPSGLGYNAVVLPSGQTATFQAGLPAPQPIVHSHQRGLSPTPALPRLMSGFPPTIRKPLRGVLERVGAAGSAGALYLGCGLRGQSRRAYAIGLEISTPPPSSVSAPRASPSIPERPPPPSIGRVSPPCTTRCKPSSIAGFTSGLLITTSYTWAKGMGYQDSDDSGLLFYINQQRQLCADHFRPHQTFVQSYVYDLPFGKGKHWLKCRPGGPDSGRLADQRRAHFDDGNALRGPLQRHRSERSRQHPDCQPDRSRSNPARHQHRQSLVQHLELSPRLPTGVFGNVGRTSMTGRACSASTPRSSSPFRSMRR